jgi:hypothetical protein
MTPYEDAVCEMRAYSALTMWREGSVPITRAAREKGVSAEDIRCTFKKHHPMKFRVFTFKMSVVLYLAMIVAVVRHPLRRTPRAIHRRAE